jgi:predicted DNA-binding protein with PD1-like motif
MMGICMATYNEVQPERCFIGKLDFGSDLLQQLTSVCIKENITLGTVEAIGAVEKARCGYYDQNAKEYNFYEIDQHLEITALLGNISIRDGKPMVHAHATFTDEKANAFGGHLAEGTIVFACEFVIRAFSGVDHVRQYDEETGLPLWKM